MPTNKSLVNSFLLFAEVTKPMTSYEIWSLVLQAVVAAIAFGTFYLLFRQIKLMNDQIIAAQNSTLAQSALSITQYLQATDARAARKHVRRTLSNKKFTEWDETDRNHASDVCANFDVVAALLKAKLAPCEIFYSNWGVTICHCYEILLPHITEMRKRQGNHSKYWSNFEWLRDLASKEYDTHKNNDASNNSAA